jgi:signal transduction histidine kinase
LKADLGEPSKPIGNAFEIKKVLPNMIFNSIEVLPPEGGKSIIKTGMQKDHVQISVIDNELGMREEAKKKVFEPSFTTKRDRRSGLG